MSRKRKELPLLTNIEITTIASEGKSLAHQEGKVIFIPFGAPGDIADVQITKKKSSFMEGRIDRLLQPSPYRIKPFCLHFETCGGCKWQHIPYEMQLSAKQQQVIDAMERIGHLEISEYLPILGCRETERYRNKLEFTFSHKRWLLPNEIQENQTLEVWPGVGFHIPGMFDKVLDINQCYLGSDISDQIRLFIRQFTLDRYNDYPYFDLRNQDGMMRTLMIRTTSTGEIMVIVVFYENHKQKIDTLLHAIKEKFPFITSLLYVVNQKANDTIQDQEVVCYYGLPYIEEKMEGLRFRINPKSFYQTNSKQAYELYKVARLFAEIDSTDIVYDLYTGCGTIANFIARSAHKVIGVEYVPEAIIDARVNSDLNKISNTAFYAGDMKDVLTDDFIKQNGKPDVIITDPPRAGMHNSVIETILRAKPRRIVYVSCNPATQARDLALLTSTGEYHITKSRAVDMFPQTHHIENVVQLKRHISHQ